MPVPTSIDSSNGVRHLTIGCATRLSTSDLQFPPCKIVGSESNEDESLMEWERRENLNLDERRGKAARTMALCRCARPGARHRPRHGGVVQLAEAHAGCHHARVVRRDIKPDEEGARGRGGGRDEEGARDGVGVGRR